MSKFAKGLLVSNVFMAVINIGIGLTGGDQITLFIGLANALIGIPVAAFLVSLFQA